MSETTTKINPKNNKWFSDNYLVTRLTVEISNEEILEVRERMVLMMRQPCSITSIINSLKRRFPKFPNDFAETFVDEAMAEMSVKVYLKNK